MKHSTLYYNKLELIQSNSKTWRRYS